MAAILQIGKKLGQGVKDKRGVNKDDVFGGTLCLENCRRGFSPWMHHKQ